MFVRKVNNKGSALILGLVVGSAAILGSMALLQLSTNYLSQNSQTAKSAQSAGGDLVALDYVRGKFVFGKDADGKPVPPEWYVDPYPSAETIAQAQQSASILKIPGRVVAIAKANSSQGLVPKWESFGRKESGGACTHLTVPQSFNGENRPDSFCDIEGFPVLQFDIDKSNLGSVEHQFGVSAFIGKLNISVLSESELKNYLNGGSIAATKDNIAASAVTFRSFVPNSQKPHALSRMEVQVGNTIAEIPVDLPPEPDCNLTLLSSVPTYTDADPGFRPGRNVSFALKTNSVTVTAQSSIDGGATYQDVPVLGGQSVSTVGNFRTVSTLNLTVPQNPNPGQKLSDTTVAWIPRVKVLGVEGGTGKNCSLSVPIHQIPRPVCSLAATKPQILKGQSTVITLDCTGPQGGPVVSATIANQAVPASFKTTKKATSNYTRTEIRNSEQITAIVRGPESSITVTTQLGDVCPFNDPNYYQTLIQPSEWLDIRDIVSEDQNKVRAYDNADPIAFIHNSSEQKVLSHFSSEVPAEFLAEGQSFPPPPGLQRDGHETIAGTNCRWSLVFNTSNGNLSRFNQVVNANTLQLDRVGLVLNSSGRTSFVLPANTAQTHYSLVSRNYDLKVDSNSGKVVVKETVVYQKLKPQVANANNGRINRSPVRTWINDGDPITHLQDFWVWGETKNSPAVHRELVLSGSGEVYLYGPASYHKVLAGGASGCSEPPLDRFYVGWAENEFNVHNLFLAEIDPEAHCKPGRLCMISNQFNRESGAMPTNYQPGWWFNSNFRDISGNTYNYPIGVTQGGQAYWVEVGPDTDPQCKIQRARLRQSGCFKSDTKIMMADGTHREISKIAENDYVFNPHYQTGVRVKSLVKGPEKKSLYEVLIGKDKVQVTEDHPFFTSRGWLQTLELKTGDVLLGDGEGRTVNQVKKLKYLGPQDVWNFELDTDEPLGHVVVANGLPTGDLTTQIQLKNKRKALP